MKTPLKFLFGAAAGIVYGMAFSQKNGKKFRSELSKSKEPLKVMWEEAKKMFQDSKKTMEKHSEKLELDPMLKKLNLKPEQIKSLKEVIAQAKAKGGDAIKQLKEQFEKLSEEEPNTEKKAPETTNTKTEKKSVPKKTAPKKATQTKKREFKNKVEEEK